MTKKTAVVIPNYNGIEYIDACLRSLCFQTLKPDRIIVVDNGSEDGSREYVGKEFPWVTMIPLSSNTGFCGGVNTGIRASRDMDYVILLNNDTRVDPAFTEKLVKAMERCPKAFSAQAKMLRMDDASKIDDAGDLYCALGWSFARGKGKDEKGFRKNREIFSACAGAAIYRMSMLEETGLFDENHFAYLEDCDLGWRAQLLGWRNLFIPSAKVMHVGSASSGSIYNLFKVRNTSRNSVYLIFKNMPPWQIALNLPLLLPGFLIKAVFFARRGFGKEYREGLMKGYRMSVESERNGREPFYLRGSYRTLWRIQVQLWINVVRRLLEFF